MLPVVVHLRRVHPDHQPAECAASYRRRCSRSRTSRTASTWRRSTARSPARSQEQTCSCWPRGYSGRERSRLGASAGYRASRPRERPGGRRTLPVSTSLREGGETKPGSRLRSPAGLRPQSDRALDQDGRLAGDCGRLGARKRARGGPRRALVARGDVLWLELEDEGRRPVVLLPGRSAAATTKRRRSSRHAHDSRDRDRGRDRTGRRHAGRLRSQPRQPPHGAAGASHAGDYDAGRGDGSRLPRAGPRHRMRYLTRGGARGDRATSNRMGHRRAPVARTPVKHTQTP